MSSYSDTSSSAAARRVLPPTSPKTPVGRSVPAGNQKPGAPVASRPAKPTKAPAKPSVSDPYGVQPLVQAEVQPQLAAIAAQQAQTLQGQAQQRQAISSATSEFLKYLTGQPSVQDDYAKAAGQESALGSAAASFLQGQNPGTDLQAQIAKLNPDQAAQIGGQLGNTFNGGAAALYGLHGLIPGSQLAENGAAAAAFQKSQAPNVALQGLDNLKQFQYNADQSAQKIAAQRAAVLASIPGLTAKANSTAATQNVNLQYKQAQLGLAQARITNQATEFTTRQKQQQAQFIQRQRQSAEQFNARQSNAAQKQSLPSASLSQKVGYLVDAAGNPILNPTGKRQILPGFKTSNGVIVPRSKGSATSASGTKIPTGDQVSKLVDQWKNGKSTLSTVQAANPDARGNPVYKSVRSQTGKLNYLQAYKRLTAMGLDDKSARQYLDTAYQKGEQGRAWLTNEQQAALQKAGRQSYVGKYQGHAFIAVPQAQALKSVGLLPDGELVGNRYFIKPGF